MSVAPSACVCVCLQTFGASDTLREEQRYITEPASLQVDTRDASPQIVFSSAAIEIKFSGPKVVRGYFLLWGGFEDRTNLAR